MCLNVWRVRMNRGSYCRKDRGGKLPANWNDLHLRSILTASTSNTDQVPAHNGAVYNIVMYLFRLLCESLTVKNADIMYLLRPISILATIAASITAQDAPVAPSMSLIYHMEADLGEPFNLGPVPNGQQRTVIPIIGGFFKGERLSGAKLSVRD